MSPRVLAVQSAQLVTSPLQQLVCVCLDHTSISTGIASAAVLCCAVLCDVIAVKSDVDSGCNTHFYWPRKKIASLLRQHLTPELTRQYAFNTFLDAMHAATVAAAQLSATIAQSCDLSSNCVSCGCPYVCAGPRTAMLSWHQLGGWYRCNSSMLSPSPCLSTFQQPASQMLKPRQTPSLLAATPPMPYQLLYQLVLSQVKVAP